MRIADVGAELGRVLAERGWSVESPPPASALVDAMIGWYASARVDGVDLADNGDMLLFQWGIYDFFGEGPSFQLDITRQLIDDTEPETDDGLWQLAAILHFPVSEASTAVGEGSRWCDSPSELDSFKAFIDASPAMQFAGNRAPARFELTLGEAG